ncbi:TRAP transporter TatT component family protein [Candidatus Uabimicrobium sp. HlEnr_7]|uniref:TRAP transporter TatT component family protein n=1 Tax=Candidatus Uabimicrobium helgolandensis TaxID=3095367 RepID=UPI003558BFDE
MKLVVIMFCFMIFGCSFDSIAKEQFIENMKESQKQIQKTENFFLVEKATPSMLLMLDSFILKNPSDKFLLVQGAQLHSMYGALFVQNDNSVWASMHYKQAKEYATKACGLEPNILQEEQNFIAALDKLNPQMIEALFWLATSWGSFISVNADNITLLDELTQVEASMKKVISWDKKYQDGLPFMFLGKLKSKNDIVESYFKTALEISQRKLLLIHVEYAKTLARFSTDESLFEGLLNEVVDTWENRKSKNLKQTFALVNSVSYNTAKNLLDNIEEFYDEEDEEDDEEDYDEDDNDEDDYDE